MTVPSAKLNGVNGVNGVNGFSDHDENKQCFFAVEEDIAIIGLACRFAGEASDASNLWNFVLQGGCASGPVPGDRFNPNAYYHPEEGHSGATYAKGAYFIDGDITAFDAPFFSMSQSNIMAMDPQQRLLLESTYQSLENG
jgi:acyl transferase domain-containing protein